MAARAHLICVIIIIRSRVIHEHQLQVQTGRHATSQSCSGGEQRLLAAACRMTASVCLLLKTVSTISCLNSDFIYIRFYGLVSILFVLFRKKTTVTNLIQSIFDFMYYLKFLHPPGNILKIISKIFFSRLHNMCKYIQINQYRIFI